MSDPQQSSIDDVVTRAHAAWALQQLEVAADLFHRASIMEREAATKRSPFAKPDLSFLYAIRSAVCLWDAGRHADARPVMEQALTFDWVAARTYADRHVTEWAFARLLVECAAHQDRGAFVALWERATLRGQQLAYPFPSIIPNQKKLLNACMSVMFVKGCQQIISRIDHNLLLRDHELKLLHSQASALCRPN